LDASSAVAVGLVGSSGVAEGFLPQAARDSTITTASSSAINLFMGNPPKNTNPLYYNAGFPNCNSQTVNI
jgi:hypothetical protein